MQMQRRLNFLMLATTLPFIIYIILFHAISIRQKQLDELNKLTEIATLTAAEHKQIHEGARQLLISLSAVPRLSSGTADSCSEFLKSLKGNYVRYVNFGVIDQSENLICAADLEQAKNNPPNQSLIAQTQKSQAFVIGSYYVTNNNQTVLNAAYPLPGGRVVYASLSLDWIGDYVNNLDTPNEVVINILDKNGTVLARRPQLTSAVGKNFATDPLVQEILDRNHGQTSKVGIDNVKRIYAFTALDERGSTYIAAGVSQKRLYSYIQNAIYTSLFTTFSIITISFLLTQEIGKLLIIKQIESMKAIEKLKDEFVSLASHQIRSPLTAIRWLTESLQESKTPISSLQKKTLAKIHHTTLRLIHLTSALLNVSRLESGTLVPHPKRIPVSQIIESVLSELRPTAKQAGVHIHTRFKKTMSIYTDPNMVSESIRILLENAMKYSAKGGRVQISAHSTSETVKIEISDNGIGIPKHARERLFTRFYRADNALLHTPEGNGLGLYLARMMVEKLQGTLTYKSRLNKGTTFVLTLPNRVI